MTLRFSPDTTGDIDSYTLDFTAWLAADPGDTIVSAVVSVTPPGMTVLGTVVINGGLVSQQLSGGVLGTDYTVSYAVTTFSGREATRDALLFCGPAGVSATSIVTLLGARALRKIGVTMVSDANRPSAAAPRTAAQIADDVLLQMGIIVPEADRPAPGPPIQASEIAARALREVGINPQPQPWPAAAPASTAAAVASVALIQMGIPVPVSSQPTPAGNAVVADLAMQALRDVGINPAPDTWPAAGSSITSAAVALVMLTEMGIPVPVASQPTPAGIVTEADIAAQALRDVGINPAPNTWPAAGATVAAADVAAVMLVQMGIPVPVSSQPVPAGTLTQAQIAGRALIAVGVNPADESSGLGSGVAWTHTDVANAALLKLSVVSPTDSGPSSEDLAYAVSAALAVHDILVATEFVTWTPDAIPNSVYEFYIDMTAQTMAPSFGKPASAEAFLIAKGMIREQALAGPAGEALAEAKVSTVHEELNALGLVSWAISAIPSAEAEHYVRLTAILLKPDFAPPSKPQSPQELAAGIQAYQALIADVRRAALLRGVEARAALRISSVHEELNAFGFVTWTVGTIPAALLQDYAMLASTTMVAEGGKALSVEEYAAVVQRIRMLVLSGPLGLALATAKVANAHEQLNSLGLVSWLVSAIPSSQAEYYVRLTSLLLAPIYKPPTAEEAAATYAANLGVIGDVRRAALLVGVEARAASRVATVHEELNAFGFVTWTANTIPAALQEHYAMLASSMMVAEGGKALSPEEFAGVIERIRMLVLSGPQGLLLAEAKIASAHEELNALALVSWPITAIPSAEAEHYVRLAALLLAPIYKRMAPAEIAANAAAYAGAIAEVQHAALLRGVQVRASARVVLVHELLNQLGFVTWTSDQIPSSLVDLYARLVSSMMEAEGGKALSTEEFAAVVQRVKMIVLSGQLGLTLAEVKVAAVHDELVALSLVPWSINAVPTAAADYYAELTASKLWPIYKPESPEDREANLKTDSVIRAALTRAAFLIGATARAINHINVVHEELNALSLVTWTSDTIPASASDCYRAMASAKMVAEGGKPLPLPEYEGWVQRVRMIAMGGPAGQALAEQKVLAVHYSLEARGRIRFTIYDIPDWAWEPYVLKAATLLGPECFVKVDPMWDMQAERELMRIVQLPSGGEPVQVDYF
jgi:hypothetical protein